MPKRTKTIYPKSVTMYHGKIRVQVYSKELKKSIYVGSYDTIAEAVVSRDRWLVDNYNQVKGYSPRGIAKSATMGKYRANFSIGNNNKKIVIQLGTYDSLDKAMEARRSYILSLL